MDLKEIPELSDGFKIIPSLAVMGRTPVWAGKRKYNPITFNDKTVSPQAIARVLSERFDTLHYLDITGIRKGKVEWNTFQSVMDEVDEVWADVGITFSDTIIDALMSGASFGIISTKMIQSLEEIAAAFELTENIILQIDHDGALVAHDPMIGKMLPSDLVKEMRSFGMDTFIIESVAEERDIPSPDVISEVIGELPNDGRVYVGSNSVEGLVELDKLGVDGGIISVSRVLRGLR